MAINYETLRDQLIDVLDNSPAVERGDYNVSHLADQLLKVIENSIVIGKRR